MPRPSFPVLLGAAIIVGRTVGTRKVPSQVSTKVYSASPAAVIAEGRAVARADDCAGAVDCAVAASVAALPAERLQTSQLGPKLLGLIASLYKGHQRAFLALTAVTIVCMLAYFACACSKEEVVAINADQQEGDTSNVVSTAGGFSQGDVVSFSFLLRTGRFADYVILMGSISTCWLSVSTPDAYLTPWMLAQGFTFAQAGVFLAAQPLAVMAVQPFMPRLGSRFGQGTLLTSGLTLSATSLVCFALTPMVGLMHGTPLFAALFMSAWLAGIGEGIVETCVYTKIAERFPDVVSQMAGHADAWIGIGSTFGPPLGGVLFSLGGFSLPVAAVSVLFFCLAAFVMSWTKASEVGLEGMEDEEEVEENVRQLADEFIFWLVAAGIGLAGFIQAGCCPMMTEHWVRKLGWSAALVGTILFIYGSLYIATAFFSGIVADRGPCMARCMFASGALVAACGVFASGWLSPGISVAGYISLGISDALLLTPGMAVLLQFSPTGSSSFPASVLNGAYAFGEGLGGLASVPFSQAFGLPVATSVLSCVASTYALALTAALALRSASTSPSPSVHHPAR
mmetsp:Transcript_10470/g.27733  ORF Transcript_10470/g.27733 Transcript_10470/m.27733 type:complete len:568 (-) Transcript_10470:29-1732(-)